MKKYFVLLMLPFFMATCGHFSFAKNSLEEIPSAKVESLKPKKQGGNDLATAAKNAKNLNELQAVVVKLIKVTTGGK